MKKALISSILVSASIFLSGCAGGSSDQSTNSSIPPVFAQQSYSNSTLSGTYAASFLWDQSAGAIGTIQFDGNGNISGGSINLGNGGSGNVCTFTLTGKYSVQSTGLGSATLNGTTTSSSCYSGTSFSTPLSMAIGQQGATIYFLTNSGDQAPVFGWASKQ